MSVRSLQHLRDDLRVIGICLKTFFLRWRIALCLMIAANGVGCARSMYTVTKLPEQFAAQPVRDFSTFDLTRFAESGVDDERILPGDRLRVRVNTGAWGEGAEQEWTVGVDDIGQAALPNIGPVQLAGMTRTQAERSIVQTSLQRDVYRTPAVDLQVAEREMRTVVVMGAVNRPGPLQFRKPRITLADVVARAGGMTSEASGDISISGAASVHENTATSPAGHGARTVSLYNTSESELSAIIVPEGAAVMIETTPVRRVQVMGVIRNRTIEMPPGRNLHLLDALTMAGGATYSNWILDKVHVIRQVPGSNETVRVKASIRAAKKHASENLLLAPNDIVSVEENVMTFTLSTVQSLFAVGSSGARLAAF